MAQGYVVGLFWVVGDRDRVNCKVEANFEGHTVHWQKNLLIIGWTWINFLRVLFSIIYFSRFETLYCTHEIVRITHNLNLIIISS